MELPKPLLVQPAPLTDWAHQVIKEHILNLRIPPGAQINIDNLADQMGISRTPIREALLRLGREGLVRIVPRVGFFTTQVTRRDLEELFELRELLESYAAEKAAPMLTDDDLAEIDRLLAANISAAERGDMEKFLETEIAFHAFIVEHARSRQLIAVMQSIRDLTYRERVLSLDSLDNIRASLAEHQRVVEALHQLDGKVAGQRVREHISAVKDRMLQFVIVPQENDDATGLLQWRGGG